MESKQTRNGTGQVPAAHARGLWREAARAPHSVAFRQLAVAGRHRRRGRDRVVNIEMLSELGKKIKKSIDVTPPPQALFLNSALSMQWFTQRTRVCKYCLGCAIRAANVEIRFIVYRDRVRAWIAY
ncbi:hypothetical protein EVAR_47029_1 [Eumeta japonica]|uniref:Uncharacterized protein n=1 Tax=Eumeta variegata TaxID=151549 RepID=A0A4C1XHY7_EUMVA|nr:hypothetical protein EVAR_47029_1 [Eumeta japonica]